MPKIDALRRFLLPCFTPTPSRSSSTATTATSAKKRLSTSLRDDIIDETQKEREKRLSLSLSSPEKSPSHSPQAPPRPSRTMVIGTLFGRRRGTHVWFCIQPDRFSLKPSFLIQLPLSTAQLVKEMQCGSVRIALESETGTNMCPLRAIDTWAMCCNGRRLGFAARKKANEATRVMLGMMRGVTVGAGVIPGNGEKDEGEIMYMRANYECIVGGPDSESFHLVSPDQCPGQEFSIYLLRSR